MAVQKRLRAAEYRRLALEASVLAEGSTLENVRHKHELAAEVWAGLASRDEDDGDTAAPTGESLNPDRSQKDVR